MRETDRDAANTTINSIAEAILSLAQQGDLLLGKREQGGKRLSFDFQKQVDEGYVANFFARDSFELKLSHQGRNRIVDNGSNRMGDESDDRKFARLAIEEARQSVPEDNGKAHPMVGAVVVKNGQVLATAHRGEAEGNHAEYFALEEKLADAAVAGATVYTTLEPCTTRNHPKIPCVERLVERKIGRVVIGMLDPDPRIRGLGQKRLRSANIITDLFPHDLMAEVEELNRKFTRAFESPSKIPESPHPAFEPASEGALHKATIERLSRHRASVSKKLEDVKEFGLVEIACRPVQPVDIPVPGLEKFIQRSRPQFSEAMRHFPTVEVFQNGVSVGYFPRGLKSTVRFTLYKDGFVAFDALVDFFVRGDKGLHAGWLSYELQRQLQFVKDLLKASDVHRICVVLNLENIESHLLNVPAESGLWVEHSEYAGPHEPISRTINLSEIHDHAGDKRNTVMPVVVDIMDEVYRIFGLPTARGLWDENGKLLYVKGLENQR